MKLLINIDENLLNRVMKLTRAKTKKDAIVIPMREFLKQQERNKLIQLIDKGCRHGMTVRQLKKQRKTWKRS